MPNATLVRIALALLVLNASSAPLRAQTAADSLFIRSAQYPTETVHLHCDKYVIPAGDTLWWKGYIFKRGRPSNLSSTLYIALISSDGQRLSKHPFPVYRGLSAGQLSIPDTLPPGRYWLLAYTQYQLNFAHATFFCAPLTVYRRHSNAAVPVATPPKPENAPWVLRTHGLMLVATSEHERLTCHIDEDEPITCRKALDIYLTADQRPLQKASFTLNPAQPWKDLSFDTRHLYGAADLLVFSHDSLIGRLSVNLGTLPTASITVAADTLSSKPDGDNALTITLLDSTLYNCSVSVTDADRTAPLPATILDYPVTDPFDYQAAASGHYPRIETIDSNRLSLTGSVLNTKGTRVNGGALVGFLSSSAYGKGAPFLANLDDSGHFRLDGIGLYDTVWMDYQLNHVPGDPDAQKVTIIPRQPRFPQFIPDTRYRDTLLSFSTPDDSLPDSAAPTDPRYKTLPTIVIKNNVRKELDDRYTRGIFSEPTPFSFDLRTDKSVHSIWQYLRKNLPGFAGGPDIGQSPAFDDSPVLFYVDNQPCTPDRLNAYWYEEIAYIKAYHSLWIDQTPFMKWLTGYKGFELTGGAGFKIPKDSDPPVICLYTRKGADIRSGWPGLPTLRLAGYARIQTWSPSSTGNTTLYWAPLQAGNRFHIRFHNYGTTRYRLAIEGVAQNGQVVHYETILDGQLAETAFQSLTP